MYYCSRCLVEVGFIKYFFNTVNKLQEMEVEINPYLWAILLLNSLPSNFENFRWALETWDTRKNEFRSCVQNAIYVKNSSYQ